MYVYIVREPFMGFGKGAVLSQAQVDAYAEQGGHLDHHAVRQWRDDPVPAPARIEAKPSATAPPQPTAV